MPFRRPHISTVLGAGVFIGLVPLLTAWSPCKTCELVSPSPCLNGYYWWSCATAPVGRSGYFNCTDEICGGYCTVSSPCAPYLREEVDADGSVASEVSFAPNVIQRPAFVTVRQSLAYFPSNGTLSIRRNCRGAIVGRTLSEERAVEIRAETSVIEI